MHQTVWDAQAEVEVDRITWEVHPAPQTLLHIKANILDGTKESANLPISSELTPIVRTGRRPCGPCSPITYSNGSAYDGDLDG
jgi:hypothetical protein